MTITSRITVSDYTNKVLNEIKAKYSLNTKSEALDKFAEECGEIFVEKEANDEYVKKIIKIKEEHIAKYGKKTMSLKELDMLCDMD